MGRRRALLASGVLLGMVMGCGGGQETRPDPPPSTSAAPGEQTVGGGGEGLSPSDASPTPQDSAGADVPAGLEGLKAPPFGVGGVGGVACPEGSFRIQRGQEITVGTDMVAEARRLVSGSVVTFCPGRLEVHQSVVLKELRDVRLEGLEGAELVARGDFPVLQIQQSTNITVTNLRVVHDIGEWCAQNCVEIYASSSVSVEGCELDGSGYYGLTIHDAREVKVIDNHIHNCAWALWAYGSQGIQVRGNHIHGNREGNFEVDVTGPQFANDVMKDNTFAPPK